MCVLFLVFFAEVEAVCFADLYPQIRSMASRSLARVLLMFAGMLAFLCAITFNTLSAFGAKSGESLTPFHHEEVRSGQTRVLVFAGVFHQSTEEVILKYKTPITPAPWALVIWDYAYLWIFTMFLYFIVGLCRRFPPHRNPLIRHHGDILSSFSDITLYTVIPPQADVVPSSKSDSLIPALDRNVYNWMYTTPAVIPYGFHISIIINICLKITWQILFDRE